MKSTSTLLAAVALLAALGAEMISIKREWSADIRMECLCWAGLALIPRIQRYSLNGSTARAEPNISPTPSWMLCLVSLAIATSQIVPLYYNVKSMLPLVTIITFLYSLRASWTSPLPGPVSALGAAFEALSTPKGSRLPWTRACIVVVLGVCAYILLQASGSDNDLSYVACAVFTLSRALTFILLAACKDYGPWPEERGVSLNAKIIASRVFCMVTGVMVVFPPHSSLSWSMVFRAFFSATEIAATFYLVHSGGFVFATTINTYSMAAVATLIAVLPTRAVYLSGVSLATLAQGILCLPLSVSNRKLLLFIFIPALAILYRASETFSSGFYNDQHAFHSDISIHPIEQLASQAESRFQEMVQRQSQTLEDAYAEYERRYKQPPPPNFDKWFSAAKAHNFVLIDEFDTMMQAMEPLWGVSPADLRGRVESALNSGHMSMIRFAITDHVASYSMENFAPWMAQEVHGWLSEDILNTLPDLVFAINIKDEPKVVVAHDVLEAAQRIANNETTSLAPSKNPSLSQRVDFLEVGKQNAWEAMTLSCPVDSPARDFSQPAPSPNSTVLNIKFLSNVTMSKDVCLFPELRYLHGSLLSPESLSLTHSIVPVFSQAKLSCFQDILYPSPWYAAKLRMQEYHESEDMDWDQKRDVLYWVGSTTGGHSTLDNWKSFQRQRLALLAASPEELITLMRKEPSTADSKSLIWRPVNSTISEISSLLNIRISAVIQCDDDACEAQKAAFNVEPGHRDDVRANYEARYNIDLDGNGFSGRFYRALRSKSAVLKQTLYKEWHDDWLVPWVHYIPVSMTLEDLPEIIRYLNQEPEGQTLGQSIAERSRAWADKVLRAEDFRLVFWRLMLEYARVMDDERDVLRCCT
ncbi:hypothetical protein VTN00DRAFT_2413 [Thermoascus crustaceus]|uniref:uncharacterized protein n=1 Tax=Thermoascus crustaceus TaxID=5088 RepID=UPI003741F285